MDQIALVDLLRQAAGEVRTALSEVIDWGPDTAREGHYLSDLVADAAVLRVLEPSGLAILSEESGWGGNADRSIVVVVDPLDGSTNASRGLPWYATSLCACDSEGPLAAVVMNLVSGETFEAVRGAGARRDGEPLAASGASSLGESLVVVSGLPPRSLGWRQFRALGAAALDLCAVACGQVDAYLDFSTDALACWDYLGAMLVCSEAGVPMVDAFGRELLVLSADERRNVVAGATPQLLGELLAAHGSLDR